MGNAESTEKVIVITKEEVVQNIYAKLKKVEESIEKIRKEDVHYRMPRLMFMLNFLKEINPYLTMLEQSQENLDLEKIQEYFNELFEFLWKNDRDQFYYSIMKLSEYIKTNKEKIEDFYDTKTQINNMSN